MSRTVSFSMTDQEHLVLKYEAFAKGLGLSRYCKMATFSYANKYPTRGVMADMARRRVDLPKEPSEIITQKVIDEIRAQSSHGCDKNGRIIRAGSVYLLTKAADMSGFKIGISTDTAQRITDIENQANVDIKLIYSFPVQQRQKIEWALHEHFNKKRVRSEWFALDEEDIKSFPAMVDYYSREITGCGLTALDDPANTRPLAE